MCLSIDRINEEFAVCQDLLTEKMLKINIKCLPKNIKEGDVLTKNAKGSFFINKVETEKRRKKILNLQNRVFNMLKED